MPLLHAKRHSTGNHDVRSESRLVCIDRTAHVVACEEEGLDRLDAVELKRKPRIGVIRPHGFHVAKDDHAVEKTIEVVSSVSNAGEVCVAQQIVELVGVCGATDDLAQHGCLSAGHEFCST